MILKPPFEIGSRLLPALQIGDGTVSLERLHVNGIGRTLWRYHIDVPGHEFSAADLLASAARGAQFVFCDLLEFLEHSGEAYTAWHRTGSKADEEEMLFTVEVCEWASANLDRLQSLRLEIEETPGLILEG